jgi:predicted Zn-dependent protease with MMP-like domain
VRTGLCEARWPMAEDETLERRMTDLLEELAELMDSDPEAAIELAEKGDPELSVHPEVRLARCHALWLARGVEAAKLGFEALIAEHADYADAHADLAVAYDEIGDEARRNQHLLRVLALDTAQDRELGFDASEYEGFIVQTAERTLSNLPPEFRQRLRDVPVLLEERPAEALVSEGFDPRALGLFEGGDHAHHRAAESSDTPTRIVLYTANLTAACEDPEELQREVEITVLHEIGHYFGLDEDDMARLGLD